MHPCLRVLEILTNIFESRECYSPYNLILKPYSLALVCKTFSGPALDLLWRRQVGIRQLLKCCPADLWDESDEVPMKFLRVSGLVPHLEVVA